MNANNNANFSYLASNWQQKEEERMVLEDFLIKR